MVTNDNSDPSCDDFDVPEREIVAGKFIGVLGGSEHPALIMAAAFELIECVVCHLDPSDWDVAEEFVKTASATVLKRMRDTDREEAGGIH